MNTFPASFDNDDAHVRTGPRGQVAHRDLVAHSELFDRRLWAVRPGVWSLVGNGLSNQNFIEGPEGIIAIDTGESNEEMRAALASLREVTDAPIVAVMYTHFHYVAGTQAIFDEAGSELPVWGHSGILGNRARMQTEVGPAAGRGLVHQFGMQLPTEGPDAIVNVGLGTAFRHPEHAPFTPGFVAPSKEIDSPTRAAMAGLAVEIVPAPSDADDSVTIWFPDLGVCVNNLVWPTLFNVFAIRGEEYRDPRVLLDGLDHIAALDPEHLVGAHGPPISGRARIRVDVEEYRDSIQFMWDQTVRGLNRGLTSDELTEFVQLPSSFDRTHLTRQFYGLVEHHVRQIHNGLRGWFDGHEANLFPVPPGERCRKLIAGFGGVGEVRSQAAAALEAGDVRWAVELASWLVRGGDGTADDRGLLASALRTIAQRTTSSNARNWCLTRALELEGEIDLSRLRAPRFSGRDVLAAPSARFVHGLRVLLDPQRADGLDAHVRFDFADGAAAGLHIRRGVAVPTGGADAEHALGLDLATWAEILGGKLTLDDAVDQGRVTIDGDVALVRQALGSFDLATLAR